MMHRQEIINRCTTKLKMTSDDAEWTADNLYMYEVPDWSEWTQRQIDECFRGVLWFRGKTKAEIMEALA